MNRVHMNPCVTRRLSGDSGASLIEYVLLLSLIALVCLAAVTAFGSTTRGSIDDSTSQFVNAGS